VGVVKVPAVESEDSLVVNTIFPEVSVGVEMVTFLPLFGAAVDRVAITGGQFDPFLSLLCVVVPGQHPKVL
jgi:hypothetical protein